MAWNYLLAVFGFLLLPGFFVIWVVFLIRKRQRLWATATLLSLLLLAGLKFIVPRPHDMVLYGLRNGMIRHFGAQEMRHFAADFDKLPALPDPTPPVSKFYDNRSAINELKGTGLRERYPYLANCEFIRQSGDVICVNWGGLDNHWGFYVTTDGKALGPKAFSWFGGKNLHVGSDICFFSEY